MRKQIKAYHQVGGDDKTPEERSAFLDQILDLGEIIPAVDRVQRSEMRDECFGDSQGCQDIPSFTGSPKAIKALELIAEDKIAMLPERGSTRTMFNCLDLLAGDFERIFLSIGDWYNFPSGFVFDAEELLKKGAAYRSTDLLSWYRYEVDAAVNRVYGSVKEARRGVEAAINKVLINRQSIGKEAVTLLRADCAPGKCPGEIVWPGSLPLGLAIEMWSEGRLMTFKEGVRR